MIGTFGNHVRKKRLEKDLSLRDLANLTGLDHSYIGRLEKGSSVPSRETATKLASALDISVDKLMKAAGYLPDAVKEDSLKYSATTLAYNEAMSLLDEIEREIQIAKESGKTIDRTTAQMLVEHRRRILAGEEGSINYIYQAETLGDALLRIAEMDFEYDFDEETFAKLVIKAREKYGLPSVKGADPAAHGPNYPGSGIFDEHKDNVQLNESKAKYKSKDNNGADGRD